MLFMEKQLVFGCTSSPGLYDWIAKTVIQLALLMAGVPKELCLQCLDDVVYFSSQGSSACWDFFEAYKQVCARIGVSLASEDDPSKAFAPCSGGIILGIHYDLDSWTWKIPDDKISFMMKGLFAVRDQPSVSMEEMQELVGRVNHYHLLIPQVQEGLPGPLGQVPGGLVGGKHGGCIHVQLRDP